MAGGTFGGGSGTSASPYLVEDAADINNVRNNLSGNYIQMADIDLSGYENWVPISQKGAYPYTPGPYFTGTYDGNNFIISNLTIDRPTEDTIGLFGFVENGAAIKNINIVDANVLGKNYVGLLIGAVDCSGVGGKVTIDNCSVAGTVNGYSETGMLIGNAFVYETDDITVYDLLIEIKKCCASGVVGGQLSDVSGGLIGYAGSFNDWANITIDECEANVQLSGTSSPYNCGGLIGQVEIQGNSKTTISDCYSNGSINGDSYVGGFVGCIFKYGTEPTLDFLDCYSSCQVTGFDEVGGFIGYRESYSTPFAPITSCYYDSQVSGQSDTGKGAPKTTAEMKLQSTYSGWDFNNVWGIDSSVNNGYPYLRYAAQPLNLQTAKKYALVSECLQTDPDATMNYNDKWYKFVAFIEEFEPTVHEAAGESSTYNYGGGTITYSGQPYTFLASGVTNKSAPGGYSGYSSDTQRTVLSVTDRENYVLFYYTYPALGKVIQPAWVKKVLAWKDIANAERYEVKLYNASAECIDTQTVNKNTQRYDYTDLIENYLPAGSYTATVQALPGVSE